VAVPKKVAGARQRSNHRLSVLDGVRGVAALGVVIYHLLSAFVPRLSFDNNLPHPAVASSLFHFFYNGRFFVFVFFVLSGFVIANSASSSRQPLSLRIPLRYLRLTVPAVVSVAWAWALTFRFPGASRAVVKILPQQWILFGFGTDLPPFCGIFLHSPIDIYSRQDYRLNGSLWTLRTELIGSIVIYLVFAAVPKKYRLVVLGSLSILGGMIPQPIFLLSFFLGAAIWDCWMQGGFERLRRRPVVVAAIVLATIVLGSVHQTSDLNPTIVIWPAGAALALVSVMASAPLATLLSGTVPQFLGRISFCLYLIHMPLVMTGAAAAYVALAPMTALGLIAFFLGFVLIAVTIAYTMTIAIDEPLLLLLRRVFPTKVNLK
jgi:peptidoglycan/LPS O-acetylase OafA/YrhL